MLITGLDPACMEAEERAQAAGLPLMLVAAQFALLNPVMQLLVATLSCKPATP